MTPGKVQLDAAALLTAYLRASNDEEEIKSAIDFSMTIIREYAEEDAEYTLLDLLTCLLSMHIGSFRSLITEIVRLTQGREPTAEDFELYWSHFVGYAFKEG